MSACVVAVTVTIRIPRLAVGQGYQQRQRACLIQPALTPAHNAGGLAVLLGDDAAAQPDKYDEIS